MVSLFIYFFNLIILMEFLFKILFSPCVVARGLGFQLWNLAHLASYGHYKNRSWLVRFYYQSVSFTGKEVEGVRGRSDCSEKDWGEEATLSCTLRLWLKTFSMNAATWFDGVLTSNEEQKTAQKTFLAGVCLAKSYVKYCCARHGGVHMGPLHQ